MFFEFLRLAVGAGLEPRDITPAQMAVRMVVVYAVGLALLRIDHKRFQGHYGAFDTVVAVMLGAILSRPVNGSARMLPSLVAATTLVAVHRILAVLAYRFHVIGDLVKGKERLLVEDGRVHREALRAAMFSSRDLAEALRQEGGVDSIEGVKAARLERSGRVSVVRGDVRVTEIKVEGGVQTVRLETLAQATMLGES